VKKKHYARGTANAELRDASLLAAATNRVQVLPMVAATLTAQRSSEQTRVLEERAPNRSAHELDTAWQTLQPNLFTWHMNMHLTQATLFLAEHDMEESAKSGLKAYTLAKAIHSHKGEVEVQRLLEHLQPLGKANASVRELTMTLGGHVMNNDQTNVIADLRYPLESRDPHDKDRWSQWRLLPMIEMSALDTYHFVQAMISQPKRKILEVGCGNGYLSLELAREGHEVVGLDTSQEILKVAERTKNAHPAPPQFGELTYLCADITTWQAAEGSFDLVVINRTLHHLHQLQPTLANVKRLLTSGGSFICQDYAYDRFNDQTASWTYAMQRLFFLSGLSDEDPATSADDARSIEALRVAWFQKAEQRAHRLNRYEEMLQAFQTTFHQQFVSWVPYLFVYMGNALRETPPEQTHALIVFLKNIEQHLIAKEYIQAVGFRYVGTVRG
jgi:2-polyprenyl-3-methyl-5-hydroxy-6-metoxy-1,4-benzoquinol methylase